MKVINNVAAMLSVLIGTAILFNSCGNEKSDRKEENGKPVPPVITQPRPPETNPNSTTTNPNQPNPENPGAKPADPKSGTQPGGTKAGAALYPLIEVGEHKQASPELKYELVTKETLRCRIQGATILHPDSEKSVPQTGQLESSYRQKHHFPNFFDPCRQDLGLTGSFGHYMKLENLVRLESCIRNRDISKSADPAVRNEARLGFMLEQLSMLCQLENSRLTPEVQKALSEGFVETWMKLE